MKPNPLYLIKKLNKKIESLEKIIQESQMKCDEMEGRVDGLEKLLKEVRYILGR
tara:strand:- start:116 stop:277 length:162 start_codon:yes stop_codon:yes gene_type:complete